ncbi:hypothetical protein LOD99_11278 [Oopsacas minuta]|uniref:THAP-type domain-containing protein n=1 Tax=Oopsacas minuta TaxID=111878 RepID=A0AAV7K8Q4_9METZ|nr:hypothetical protein LOD99_11278 [Oopsacas minuta]
MLNKCSAPGCRSNYEGEPHTPIFKMLSGPPRIVSQWKQFLHREFIEEIKRIYVCLQNFRDEDVSFSLVYLNPTVPSFKSNAVSLDFAHLQLPALPCCPSYIFNSTQWTSTQSTRLDLNTKYHDHLALGLN